MSNRLYKPLTDKFLDKVKSLLGERSKPETPQKFEATCNNTLDALYRHLKTAHSSIEDIKEKKASEGHQKNSWVNQLMNLQSQYNTLYARYEFIQKEENVINRIETKAHVRALLFRFLTTLAIGAGIMIVYFIAAQLEINLPLMRIK